MRAGLTVFLVALTVVAMACQPAAAPSPTAPPANPAPTQAPTQPAPTQAAPKPAAPTQQPAPTQAPAKPAAPTSAPTQAPTQAAAKPAAQPVALHASYSNLIADNLPEWMALESGIFKQNGLDVTLDNIASSTGIPALLGGQVNVAHLGGSETISAAAQGGDLVIIGVTEAVYPFVFMAPASITGVEELKGKKVGVSNIGSSSDIATRVFLNKVGLDPEKDVTIVPVGSLQNRIAALLNGAIDGGVAQPPDQITLEDKGFHVIYDLAAQKLPSVGNAIVVQRSWLNANKDVAQRYVDSLVQAIALSKKSKEQALPVLSKYLKNDDARALGVTYDFFVGTVTPDYPEVKPDLFVDSIQTLAATNDKIKGFDVNSIIDNEFVQSSMSRKIGP